MIIPINIKLTYNPIETPNPRFNITLEELRELANNFINPFIKDNTEILVDGYDYKTPDSTLPDNTILFCLVPGASENYIK